MTFGDQVMHSERGRSKDLEDTAYLRCLPITSATAKSALGFAGPANLEGSLAILRQHAGCLFVQNEGYKSCPSIVKKLSHICDIYCVRVLHYHPAQPGWNHCGGVSQDLNSDIVRGGIIQSFFFRTFMAFRSPVGHTASQAPQPLHFAGSTPGKDSYASSLNWTLIAS